MSEFNGVLLDCNLDACNKEELKEMEEAFRLMAQYAHQKRFAMGARMRGDIAKATILERECERIYELLPDDWRW